MSNIDERRFVRHFGAGPGGAAVPEVQAKHAPDSWRAGCRRAAHTCCPPNIASMLAYPGSVRDATVVALPAAAVLQSV